MQKQTLWFEHLKSTYRWLGFTDWLPCGRLGAISASHQQQRPLPLATVRRMAAFVGPWLLMVLKERQQRGLGWREERDAPLIPADLAKQPFAASEVVIQSAWLSWQMERELGCLIRLTEVPEHLLPMGTGMPSEARYRALAAALLRIYQLYTVLVELHQPTEASARLYAAAARVRQHATDAGTAA